MGVKVKPLVWEESLKGRWIGSPEQPLGQMAFWIFLSDDGAFVRHTTNGTLRHPTLDAAQAAAQADFEARILSAIEPEE